MKPFRKITRGRSMAYRGPLRADVVGVVVLVEGVYGGLTGRSTEQHEHLHIPAVFATAFSMGRAPPCPHSCSAPR